MPKKGVQFLSLQNGILITVSNTEPAVLYSTKHSCEVKFVANIPHTVSHLQFTKSTQKNIQ